MSSSIISVAPTGRVTTTAQPWADPRPDRRIEATPAPRSEQAALIRGVIFGSALSVPLWLMIGYFIVR